MKECFFINPRSQVSESAHTFSKNPAPMGIWPWLPYGRMSLKAPKENEFVRVCYSIYRPTIHILLFRLGMPLSVCLPDWTSQWADWQFGSPFCTPWVHGKVNPPIIGKLQFRAISRPPFIHLVLEKVDCRLGDLVEKDPIVLNRSYVGSLKKIWILLFDVDSSTLPFLAEKS